MNEPGNPGLDNTALASSLAERERMIADSLERERSLVEESLAETAERTRWWDNLVAETRSAAWTTQLKSYQSMSRSLAGLLGGSIRDQAKVMVPFEIAEATKEFARFLGTKDPSALASSLKHALAAKQYASAAKASAATSSGGGAAAGGAAAGQAPGTPGREAEPSHHTRLIVNVGRQVGIVDTYEFARTLIDAINENIKDDVILEVQS
jgi:hypothetical protein